MCARGLPLPPPATVRRAAPWVPPQDLPRRVGATQGSSKPTGPLEAGGADCSAPRSRGPRVAGAPRGGARSARRAAVRQPGRPDGLGRRASAPARTALPAGAGAADSASFPVRVDRPLPQRAAAGGGQARTAPGRRAATRTRGRHPPPGQSCGQAPGLSVRSGAGRGSPGDRAEARDRVVRLAGARSRAAGPHRGQGASAAGSAGHTWQGRAAPPVRTAGRIGKPARERDRAAGSPGARTAAAGRPAVGRAGPRPRAPRQRAARSPAARQRDLPGRGVGGEGSAGVSAAGRSRGVSRRPRTARRGSAGSGCGRPGPWRRATPGTSTPAGPYGRTPAPASPRT